MIAHAGTGKVSQEGAGSTGGQRYANRAMRLQKLSPAKWRLEGKAGDRPGTMNENPKTRSGKTHETENFPVASRLVRAEHRPLIMAFYDFARAADDVADAPDLQPDE